MTRRLKARSPWEDRYRTPTAPELAEALGKQNEQLLLAAKERLLALESIQERVVWRGIPWRWTLAYELDADPSRALAFLIPQPARPQLSIPMPGEFVGQLPLKRLSKVIRDAIVFSANVAGVHWPTWELTNKTFIEELIGLCRRKHDFLLSTPV
jgi:hypothetical protein